MFGWNDDRGRGTPHMTEALAAFGDMLITGQSGLLSGTRVPSNLGWRSVEELKVGDLVLTFDNAMQPIVDIQRETLVLPEGRNLGAQQPVRVPKGALFNRQELWLMPDQGMMVESEVAQDVLGDPYAVVPARMLVGFRGIESGLPGDRLNVTTLAFRRDEVVYLEGGMLAHCPCPQQVLNRPGVSARGMYDVLEGRAARYLVNCLIEENEVHSLASDPADLPTFPTSRPRPGRPVPA